MNIRQLRHRLVSVPVPYRILSSVRDTGEQLFVLVEVATDEGLVGHAYLSAFSRRRGIAIRALLDELGDQLAGIDSCDTEAAWSRMWESSRLIGHSGLAAFAISAIDVALWDLKAQAQQRPLHSLVGLQRDRLPTYASDGCWLDTEQRVAEQAERFAADGFPAVKMRFGRRDPAADLAALAAVRKAVGAGVDVLVDVNQGWDLDRARKYGARLQEFGVRWFEEPLPTEDVAGMAVLAEVLPLDIVAGENAYMPAGAKQLIDQRAVDVLMPDLQRIGGVTGWMRTRALAQESGVPLAAHLFPEVSVHLMAAEPAGAVEWVSWLSPLLEEPLQVCDGMVAVPTRPGIGLCFSESAVRAHEVAA